MILDHYRLFTVAAVLLFWAGMLVSLELGARRARRVGSTEELRGIGSIEGAIFALFGLLVAFSFSGAAERIRERGMLGLNEANAIGTAFLRFDLLPETDRARMKGMLRAYAASRVKDYEHFDSRADHEAALARTAALRDRLWAELVPVAARTIPPQAVELVLGPVNESFDVAEQREAFRHLHPPAWIYAMLFVIGIAASALAGFSLNDTGRRRWLHRHCFTGGTALVLFVTFNMEYPRLGFVDITGQDRPMKAAVEAMDRPAGARPGP